MKPARVLRRLSGPATEFSAFFYEEQLHDFAEKLDVLCQTDQPGSRPITAAETGSAIAFALENIAFSEVFKQYCADYVLASRKNQQIASRGYRK